MIQALLAMSHIHRQFHTIQLKSQRENGLFVTATNMTQKRTRISVYLFQRHEKSVIWKGSVNLVQVLTEVHRNMLLKR